MIVTLAALLATQPSAAEPAVTLARVFKPKETLAYAVRSHLQSQTRTGNLQTWIPEDLDINYDFTTYTEALKTDGIAVLRYRRPFVTEVQGETFERGPMTKKEKVNFDLRMTVSPHNEIIEAKDLNPPKKTKWVAPGWEARVSQGTTQNVIGQFVGEVYRLMLFVGSFESALDFSPRTPFNAVKPGDTWQRTVGYQPQKLKGKDGQLAVQRLDFTYTYVGLVKSLKGQMHKVEGKLSFKTDLSEFINQTYGVTAVETGLKSIPLSLETSITFLLDAKTCHTREAIAQSEGGFQVVASSQDQPVMEQKIRGRTTMRLASQSTK